MSQQPALIVDNVSVAFGATQALSNVSFQIEPGEVRALLGANGAGKSTLIKVITGVNHPDSGALIKDGNKFSPESAHDARVAGTFAVFQELSIFPHLTVLENIFAGALRTKGGIVLDQHDMETQANAALDSLGHKIPLETLAGNLSISNQQIVEIVRATVNGAKLLLLDEPTSSLNSADRDSLFELIRVLRAQGTAVIYISHFLSEVVQITDTFTVLRDGKVALSGVTKETTIPELTEAMFGKEIDVSFKRTNKVETASPPLLEVTDLSAESVHSANFVVKPGEVLGIFGLIDCGATELLQALFGLRQITKGSMRLTRTRNTDPAKVRWKDKGIGMVAEDRPSGLAASRTIAENIFVVDWSAAGPNGLASPAKLQQLSSEYIEKFGIKCISGSQLLGELSGGNQQKAGLARFAITNVDVMLLSEPTRGVDMAARLELWRYIDELAAQGKAVVLATTDVEEVLALSDSIMVMRRGQLLEKQSASEVTPEELTIAATGGS